MLILCSAYNMAFLLPKIETFFCAARRGTKKPPFERATGYISLGSSGQCAVDHLLLSSVEVTNKWSCTRIPHTSMERRRTNSPACLNAIFEEKLL
jgi:hypothetical protein